MAGSRCSHCGNEEFLPFRCRLCSQPHCLDHRLPENHRCQGLGEYRSRAREERVFGLPREDPQPVRVRVRGPSTVGTAWRRVQGFRGRSMSRTLLVLLLAVYALQVSVGIAWGLASGRGAGQGYWDLALLLALGNGSGLADALAAKPWSALTSIVAHRDPFHLFFNALFLFFIGGALEERVGRRKVLGLFLVAGVASALLQAAVFRGPVLGASGAIMGLLGTLTILAPNMRVIFFFFPVPLWIMTGFFVALDLLGVFGSASGVANMAHLVGLAIGLAEGERLKRRGVLPRVATSWAFQRRL